MSSVYHSGGFVSTKMRKYYFTVFIVVFLVNCGQKKVPRTVDVPRHTGKLGVNYFKMSLLELEEGGVGDRVYRRALRYVDRALEQEVKPQYLAHKATLLFLLGCHEESTECFNSVLALSMPASTRTEILNNYACLLAKGGKKEQALTLLTQLEQNKDYLTPEVALVNQAKLYCDEWEWGVARAKLVQATKIAPDYVDARYYLGLVCYALKEYDDSLRSIERALELAPNHRGARELLVRLQHK